MDNIELGSMPIGSNAIPFIKQLGGTDIVSYIKNNNTMINELLLDNGVIVFKGFNPATSQDVENISQAYSDTLLDYVYPSTPRTDLGNKIYTSTEYPAHQEIPLHNENSYFSSWPDVLMFFCMVPAVEGGETPIADSRKILSKLNQSLKNKFMDKGIMYVRNYQPGLDIPWNKVFNSTRRSDVHNFCQKNNMSYTWVSDDHLRTEQVLSAVRKHPKSGEDVWFNQAHLFHITALKESTREMLISSIGENNLPRNTFYGDGSEIEHSILDEIRGVYLEEKIEFPWERGDFMFIDNMLYAHGRNSYKGDRKILVSMS